MADEAGEEPRRVVLPHPLVPDAFVRLSAADFGPSPEGGFEARPEAWGHDPDAALAGSVDFEHNSFAIRLSRAEAIGYGLIEPTDQERAELDDRREALVVQQQRDRAQPGPDVTVDAVLAHIGWTPAYAAHALHPACSCYYFDDDPLLCSWAVELGFTIDWDAPGRSFAIADPA